MHHCISLNGTTKHFAHRFANGFKIFGCDHRLSRLSGIDRRAICTANRRRGFLITCEREGNGAIEFKSELSGFVRMDELEITLSVLKAFNIYLVE